MLNPSENVIAVCLSTWRESNAAHTSRLWRLSRQVCTAVPVAVAVHVAREVTWRATVTRTTCLVRDEIFTIRRQLLFGRASNNYC